MRIQSCATAQFIVVAPDANIYASGGVIS